MAFLDWFRWPPRWWPPSPPPPPPTPPPPEPGDVVLLLTLHNFRRQTAGAGALTIDMRLMKAAQVQAEWMHRTGQQSHVGPGRSTVADRVRAQGYAAGWLGENVAADQDSPSGVFLVWTNSAGHAQNMVRRQFVNVGFGRAGSFWCAVFAAPMTVSALGAEEPAIHLSGPLL